MERIKCTDCLGILQEMLDSARCIEIKKMATNARGLVGVIRDKNDGQEYVIRLEPFRDEKQLND